MERCVTQYKMKEQSKRGEGKIECKEARVKLGSLGLLCVSWLCMVLACGYPEIALQVFKQMLLQPNPESFFSNFYIACCT